MAENRFATGSHRAGDSFMRTLEGMLEGCQILDFDFRYLFVNEAAARHSRKSREELTGRIMTEVYPGIDQTSIFAGLRRCMTQRVPVQMEDSYTFENGDVVWFEISVEPVPDGIFILTIEITERKQVELALRRSESSLAVTLQSIGDAVIATDALGRITRMNPTAERLTGWPLSEARGLPLETVFRIVNAETRQPVLNPVQKVLERGEVVGLANHTTLLSRDGREYQIANTASPIKEFAGAIEGVVLAFKDVTQQYRVQAMLRERERQLTKITDALPGPVCRVSADGRYLFANAAFARWFGRSPDDILGRTQAEVLGTQRLARALPYIEAARAGRRVQYETSLATPADGPRHALVTLIPDPVEGSAAHGHILVAIDITERRLAEESLQKREALLRIAGKTARLGGWAIDLPDRTLSWTEEVARLHDLDPQQVVSVEEALGFVVPETRERIRAAANACVGEGVPFDLEFEIVSARGRRLWVRSTGEAERDSEGRVVRVHGAFQDIDDHKQTQRRIADQLAELERWQRAMINRESRTRELKAEVNTLRRRLHLPTRYAEGEPQ